MNQETDLFGNVIVVQNNNDQEEFKTKRVNQFDFINDITYNKVHLFNDDTASEYKPFMINRGLSQHADCIIIANEMNKAPFLSKEMQHDFLFYSVSKRKRIGKWAKASEKDEDAQLIAKHYKVNLVVANQYLKLLSSDDLKELKQLYSCGGKVK